MPKHFGRYRVFIPSHLKTSVAIGSLYSLLTLSSTEEIYTLARLGSLLNFSISCFNSLKMLHSSNQCKHFNTRKSVTTGSHSATIRTTGSPNDLNCDISMMYSHQSNNATRILHNKVKRALRNLHKYVEC